MPRLHAGAPAAVFPRLQPHRAGLLQDEGALEEDDDQVARGALRGHPPRAAAAISAEDAQGFFEHCGYTSLQAQSIRITLYSGLQRN
jgi:hypothetical protein